MHNKEHALVPGVLTTSTAMYWHWIMLVVWWRRGWWCVFCTGKQPASLI